MLTKFLPLFFGCHQRPDRSFYYKGKQFPICARCTGILAGYLIGIVLAILLAIFDLWIVAMLCVPMLADGIIQRLTAYESNNTKRLITGIMFGIATIQVIVHIHLGTVELAKLFLNMCTKNS